MAQTIDSNETVAPSTSVSVYEAIFGRRNVKEFESDPVSDETLERLFSAAVWAPNHRLTNPTRFYAIRKDSDMRRKVAQLAWDTTYETVVNPNPDQKRRSADANRDRVLDAPAMVYVYSLAGGNEEMTEENYATSCCAVQNMALGAVGEGLALDWSTGGISKLPNISEIVGAEPDSKMVGVIFIGKAKDAPKSTRLAASEVVSWLE